MKRTVLFAALCVALGGQAAEMRVFKQPNFTGDSITLNGEMRDLGGRGFQDQVSSLVVRSGRWQVCTQPDFGGDCVTLERGEYPSLDSRLMHRIESARVVAEPVAQAQRPRWAVGGSVELYTRPGFEGRTARIYRNEQYVAQAGLDRPVRSIIVNDGSWQVCSGEEYQGFCRVLEPGEYADLGRLSGRVGSIRRVG